tara:strand:- start:351 stop:635 length:285 start_codon:yes stop_codon:yes gene_type:complete
LIGRFDLFERVFIVSRFAYFYIFFLLSCGDYWDDGGHESLGEKKVCDAIKVRVRACTGIGIEMWGGCHQVDEGIAWESDCGEVKWKLRLGKLRE